MEKRLILIVFITFLSGNLMSQVLGNSSYNSNIHQKESNYGNVASGQDNRVELKVSGVMNIVADSYVAIFNLIQLGETMEDIDERMNARILTFQSELNKVGIANSQITSDLLTFVPTYDINISNKLFSKSYNEVPSGFEMKKYIMVHYKKSTDIDAILSAALKAEIYDIVKVDYLVTNMSQFRDSLRSECLKELAKKKKLYGEVGFSFDSMKMSIADDFEVVLPKARYYSYQAFARPSLANVKKSVVVGEVPKAQSRYYSQVDCSDYDIVLNPIITEPVVQLFYGINVNYIHVEKKEEPKSCYIITSSGDAKELRLK